MVSKPQAPTPPDPAKTAQSQTTSNIDTAVANGYLNATNQSTPYGSVRYDQTGSQQVGDNSVPTFSSTTSLNPQFQSILDSQTSVGQKALDTGNQLLSNVQGTNSSPFSLQGLPPMATGASGGPIQQNLGNKDYSADGQRVSDALMSRFNTDWSKQSDANDVKLANQGIAAGSAAYGADKDALNRARNDAQAQATLAGGQEQSRLFGLDQAAGQFANSAQQQQYGQNYQNANLNNTSRQQSIAEQQTVRNQPLNELATLLGFSPGIQTPNAPSFGGNVAGTDVAGITQNNFANQTANYQAKMGQQNAMMGGLFGLGQAAMLSDRRAKTNIRRVGTTDGGLPVYTYNYKSGGPVQMGVMAQDVEKVKPWAVVEVNGLKAVNYSMVN